MTRKVPYLYEEQIERDAADLLAEYARARGATITPPIPIEDIVEKHLRLGVEFDDTHRLFDVPRSGFDPDILGAIFFDDGRIVIDESLDPEDHPSKEGRYRFTLAHEGGGHWRLHRHLFAKDPAQAVLFDAPEPPSVICRSSHAKEPVEWQADFYASCLLMPRDLVFIAWKERYPDRRSYVMDRSERDAIAAIKDDDEREFRAKVEDWSNVEAMERLVWPFAEQFFVSPIAMRIRMEKLGLLHREHPKQHILSGA